MRLDTFIFLAFTAATSAAVLQPRQNWPNGFLNYVPQLEKVATPMKPFKTLNAEANLRPNSIRKVLRYGPFTLPAAKEDGGMGHTHGAAANSTPIPFSLANMPEMSLGDLVKSMGGGPGLGLPQIKVKDMFASWGYMWNGDYEKAMSTMLNVTLDPNGLAIVRTLGEGICTDCTILAAKSDFVFEDGRRADVTEGVYLHHLTGVNLGGKPISTWVNMCPTRQTTIFGTDITKSIPTTIVGGMNLLTLGGVDEFTQYFTTPDGKFESGHYIDPKDKFFFQAEVINYKKVPQELYVQMDLEYVQGKAGKHATWTPVSVTGCSPAIGFSGRGTSGNITSEPLEIRVDGTIISGRGHMHDGGVAMQILINDKLEGTSKAIYGTTMKTTEGKDWTTIARMSDFEKPIKVKKGDQMRLVAHYDEILHPARESGAMEAEEMGFGLFTFVPDA